MQGDERPLNLPRLLFGVLLFAAYMTAMVMLIAMVRQQDPLLAYGIYALFFFAPMVLQLAYERHRRNRRRAGHCRHCGYDLRASPHQSPECGAHSDTRPWFVRDGKE
jgi:hypothetical protein